MEASSCGDELSDNIDSEEWSESSPQSGQLDESIQLESLRSSFTFTSSPLDSHLNITKYIPVGCLRVRRTSSSITDDEWVACKSQWRAISQPKDKSMSNVAECIPASFQENLLQEPDLQPILALHSFSWIRTEFKSVDANLGVIRVYVLPDDAARAEVPRNKPVLRKALHRLLNSLDISKALWNGHLSETDQLEFLSSHATHSQSDQPSLFQIFNNLPPPNPDPELVDDLGVQNSMYDILENKVRGLSTTLYQYQTKSAALMVQREVAPTQILDPRLSEFSDQHGYDWYCDTLTGIILREKKFYEAARGGICAETMGLGKTLICLAVILATKEQSSKSPADSLRELPTRKQTGKLFDMVVSKIAQSGISWKHWLADIETEGYELKNIRNALQNIPGYYLEYPPEPRRIRRFSEERTPQPKKKFLSTTTIVVVPANLVQQWMREIEKHTVAGSLNVLVMDDWKKDLPDAEKLLEYDILLFSKPRFEHEARTEQMPLQKDEEILGRRSKNLMRRYSMEEYHSPLKDVLFKRLIVDEGHAFGNASRGSRTEATTVVEFLNVSARWIISGTPTKGLYGIDVQSSMSSGSSTPDLQLSKKLKPTLLDNISFKANSPVESAMPRLAQSGVELRKLDDRLNEQERYDLEKLGNIATMYLKLRPWANTKEDHDPASWTQYMMQPRHSPKGQGNVECLRKTMEGMIIRHRPEDIFKDIALPPLHHEFVYLDGSLQNKLSLNTFFMMIITNAVTSERKDADYFFHHRQRKNLSQLVSNLRQGSFFWSGFETGHIESTVGNAKTFLEEKKVPIKPEDEALLLQAIKMGELVLGNTINQVIRKSHEMPFYVANEWDGDVRTAWALDRESNNPTLMGATLVHHAQAFIEALSFTGDSQSDLIKEGWKSVDAVIKGPAAQPQVDAEILPASGPESAPASEPTQRNSLTKRPEDSIPDLAGGVVVGDASSIKKRKVSISSPTMSPTNASILLADLGSSITSTGAGTKSNNKFRVEERTVKAPKSSLKRSLHSDVTSSLSTHSQFASASIVSTASAKLSYLMDKIVEHNTREKIIVFYESNNVAYYIAQALECLGVKHLIYAKTLHTSRRSKYIVTFNQTETFRVLLMDVSQAAFGLDLSSASRVFFVNPVFSPQVEAQAIKRAHRIGQLRPVYVETLVLEGSIEEVILQRRGDMSEQEHQKCKNILDDQTMYDWIRNVKFLDLPTESMPGPEQMAALSKPQPLFKPGGGTCAIADPDADLVGEPEVKSARKIKRMKIV